MLKFALPALAALVLAPATALAAPLSRTQPVDFFADVPSRNLQGITARSDGRLLPGPTVGPVNVRFGSELLWSMTTDGARLLIGTGPEGRILRINPDTRGEITPEVLLDLPETHVFALARLPNGDVLAGTSPQGTLVLSREGQVIARAALPVDSIFALSVIEDDPSAPVALIATGNPGRIYQAAIPVFANSGDSFDKLTEAAALKARGISLLGEIRDQNISRLLRLSDGRIIAGSSPRGNLYEFSAKGGSPRILAEHRNAEVTDLLAWDGGFFAALTFGGQSVEARAANRAPAGAARTDETSAREETENAAPPPVIPVEPVRVERFAGRGQLLWLPNGGFPETVASRNGAAFYRLQRHEGIVLISGGEQGDLFGYDPERRRSLTFPAAGSAQINGLLPAARIPGAYHAIGNNPASLSLVNFPAGSARRVESRRLDLGVPAEIGALRLGAGTAIAEDRLTVELRASYGSDEAEGWSDWQHAVPADGGWRVNGLRGRYVQARLSPATARFEIDRATLHYLPQNRRPSLQEFRVLPPNHTLIPAMESPPAFSTTLAQLLQSQSRSDERRPSSLLSSQVVPQTGAQVVVWTLNDPDGDDYLSTFSIRRAGTEAWTDLIVNTADSYLQFDTAHLPEGLYQTRLIVTETEPRPLPDRLSSTFATEDLLIDRTPPEFLDVAVGRENGRLVVSVRAKDALSLLGGLEVSLNNGFKALLEHPVDGILDGREETFRLSITAAQADGATSLEVISYDALGNGSSRRVSIP